MTGPTTLAGCAVAHELADARNQKRTQSTQTSRRTSSESRTNSESHTKSTLTPYKGQILELAMRGGVFHVKAKADVALHQAATKDAIAFRYAATKVNAKLCHAK